MTFLILNYIFYNIFAFITGMIEAYGDTDSIQPYIPQFGHNFEKHKVYTFQRILIFVMMVNALVTYHYWLHTEFYDILILFISSVLCFSFIHDGAYYTTRHNIDNSNSVWWESESKTTTAKHEYGFKTRLIMFIFGVIIILSYTIIKVLYLS